MTDWTFEIPQHRRVATVSSRCSTLAALTLLIGVAGPALAQRRETPKPTVTFATSWDAAVEEAKLLNVPIVVHSHGFY